VGTVGVWPVLVGFHCDGWSGYLLITICQVVRVQSSFCELVQGLVEGVWGWTKLENGSGSSGKGSVGLTFCGGIDAVNWWADLCRRWI